MRACKSGVALLGLFVFVLAGVGMPLHGATTEICNMTHNASPSTSACIPIQDNSSSVVKYTTIADILFGTVPATDARLLAYNVRAAPFNAVGDGVADDTAAIQSAINAAQSALGGRVHLPAGTYKVSSALTVTLGGVSIYGDGPKATLISTASTTADIIDIGSVGTPFSPCGGVSNLGIKSSVTKTAGYAISVDGCQIGLIDNVTINPTGGNGIYFGNAAVWHVSHSRIATIGNFVGITFNGANDRYLSDLYVTGDQTAGSTAILMTSSGGDWFTDVEAVFADHGVVIAPPTGKSVSWVRMSNVLADSNATDGFRFVPTGGVVQGFTCSDCWAATNGIASANGHALYIDGSSSVATSSINFSNVRFYNNGGHGVDARNMQDLGINGGFISTNSKSSSGTYSGVSLTNVSGSRISGVRIGPTAGGINWQGYGVVIDSASTNFDIVGNDVHGNLTGGVLNAAGLSSSKKIYANIGDTSDTATTSVPGYVQFAADGGTSASTAVQGSDSRLVGLPLTSGVSGGRTIVCGTGAGEDCTFTTTSNATKGRYFIGPLTVDQNASKVGIGAVATVPDSPLEISGNTATLPTPSVTGTLTHEGGADGTSTRHLMDAFGANGSYECRRADTSAASPSAVQSAETICQLAAFARDNSAYSTGGQASVLLQAAENWTTSAHGTTVKIVTTPKGSLFAVTALEVNDASHILSTQTATATVACTGTGTSPSLPAISGTDTKFTVTVNTGTGSPGSTGTCTVTFGTAYAAASPIVCMLVKGATAWGNGATIQETTESASAPVFTWTNLVGGVATALTISTSYKFSCITIG